MPAQPPSPPPRTPAAGATTPQPGQTGYVPSASGAGEEDPGASIERDPKDKGKNTGEAQGNQDSKGGPSERPAKP